MDTANTLNGHLKHSISPGAGLCASSSFLRDAVKLGISLPIFSNFAHIGQLRFHGLGGRVNNLARRVRRGQVTFRIVSTFCHLYFSGGVCRLTIRRQGLDRHCRRRVLRCISLNVHSPSSLRRIGTHLRSSVCRRAIGTGNYHLSLLTLGRLLGVQSASALTVSPNKRNRLPILPMLRSGRVCTTSRASLPRFQTVRLERGTSHGSLTVTSKTFSPSVETRFDLCSNCCSARQSSLNRVVPVGSRLGGGVGGCVNIDISLPLFDKLSHLASIQGRHFHLREVQGRGRRRHLDLCGRVSSTYLSLQTTTRRRHRTIRRLHASAIALGRDRRG